MGIGRTRIIERVVQLSQLFLGVQRLVEKQSEQANDDKIKRNQATNASTIAKGFFTLAAMDCMRATRTRTSDPGLHIRSRVPSYVGNSNADCAMEPTRRALRQCLDGYVVSKAHV